MSNNYTSHKNVGNQFTSPFRLHSPQNTPKVPKHIFTPKAAFQRYDDLDNFRQEIEQSKAGLHHQPYTAIKKAVFTYKCVFFGLGLLFCILALLALSLPSTINGGLLFGESSSAKGLVIGVCSMLTMTALAIAFAIQKEKEAVYQSVRRAKAHLAAIYGRKSLRLGLKRLAALFGKERLQAMALKHMYEESIDKINDKKDEALHLVHRIATAETLDKVEKESLLNQAIEELNEKLFVLTHTFRHATIPHYT